MKRSANPNRSFPLDEAASRLHSFNYIQFHEKVLAAPTFYSWKHEQYPKAVPEMTNVSLVST